jgi:hypothetical protein
MGKLREEQPEQKEGFCTCGASIAEGAVLCPVCKALHDRDKRKAKAKMKAKMKKGKKAILEEKEVQKTLEDLFTQTVGVLNQKYEKDGVKKAVVTATLAHMLNQTLSTVQVEVKKSFTITGKDTTTGWKYNINKV